MSKIALVTGASAGIGEATARKLAAAGYDLILMARRLERLQQLANSLKVETHLIKLDVRDREAVDRAIAELPSRWQNIDLLVNNAGLSRNLDKLHEGKPDSWDEMIDTNIKGLLYVSRAVIPGMVARGKGHVINVGSVAGHEVYPRGNVYCASKFAVDALTKGMMMDLVDTPVRVSTVDPGLVETEFSMVRFYGDEERAKKVYQGLTPLSGNDVADAIVWIASRPEHVNIAQVVIMPKAQASALVTVRKP
jgi:3-hydroxy acid dehydrogenase / malonic semialdehyde reductase